MSSKGSDDEFHDALTDVTSAVSENAASTGDGDAGNKNSHRPSHINKTNEEVVADITHQQVDYKLPDEDEVNDGEEKDPEDEACAGSEFLTDEAIVEELREREKSLTAEELQHNKEEAERMKLEANELFKKGEAVRAVEVYTDALRICPTTCTKERAILYGNRAAAKIKVDSKKSALDDCTKAIELWPDYVRALLRRAKLCENEDRLEEALKDYQRICELDPGQRDAREALARLPAQIAERNERLKTEMMSKLKDLGNMFLKPFGLSTDNFQMQQDPNTGSYSVNFQQNPR